MVKGTVLTYEEGRALLGEDPEKLARRQEAFTCGARIFSAHYERLMADYCEKWVAIHEADERAENVVAADSHEDLLAELERRGTPRGECYTRHVVPRPSLLIL